MVDAGVSFGIETPLPTVRFEDLALTSTHSADNTGVRVQVLRRQPRWLVAADPSTAPRSHSHSRPASSTDTPKITIYGWSTRSGGEGVEDAID